MKYKPNTHDKYLRAHQDSRNGVEKIECAAILYPNAIFLGKRHCDCFKVAAVNNKKWQYSDEVQGFMTNTFRFVDREVALKIALEAGQVIKGQTHKDDVLFSEDLY